MESELDLPIATATVARLYLEQGKLEQAERLYRRLLAERPADAQLSKGLTEVLRRKEVASPARSADQLAIEVQPDAGSPILCRWKASAAGIARARLVLGAGGDLALQLVTFPRRSTDSPAKTLRIDPDQLEGEVTVERPHGAALIAAAVGLLGDAGRFVAIAHCRPVPLAARARKR